MTTATESLIEIEKAEIELAKKDPRRFESLYQRYYNKMYGFVFKRVNDEEFAADIVSQTFLKALTNLSSYQYKGLPFSAWLYRIALNLCQDHFRQKKKTQTFYLDPTNTGYLIAEMIGDKEDDISELSLPKVLRDLKPKDLNLIELRFFEKLSFKEIAGVLDVSEAAAKVRLYRILKKMKGMFEAYEKRFEDTI